MVKSKSIAVITCLVLFSSCDSFEKSFYDRIDKGEVNAIKNGMDTLDLTQITDFEWDSVVLIRGNESVPIDKEDIEKIINNRSSDVDWQYSQWRDKNNSWPTYQTEELPTYKDRFYFLTPDKKMVEKEIESGVHRHNPPFELLYCLSDSVRERYWLSKAECKFLLNTNSSTIGHGTVFLFPKCITKFSANDIQRQE